MICASIDPDFHNTSIALTYKREDKPLSFYEIIDLDFQKINPDLKSNEAKIATIQNMSSFISTFLQLHEPDVLVVEGQDLYRFSSQAKDEDIIGLCQIAGAAAEALCSQCRGIPLYIPKPQTWDGGRPKPKNQKFVLERFNLPYKMTKSHTYPKPNPKKFEFKSGEWKHIVDAMGLGIWGIHHHLKEREIPK